MSATQISFAAFAQAQLQAAPESTPPASTTSVPADVVAHADAGSGGECPQSDFAEFNRLNDLADETIRVPFALFSGCAWSRGGYVLAARANCCAPLYEGRDSQSNLLDALRYHAAQCIGAGC